MLAVHGEKNDKEKGADTLVAIVKGVVFDNKVEEVGSLFGDGLVEVFAVVTLVNILEGTSEGVASGFTKEVGAVNGPLKASDDIEAKLGGEDFFFLFAILIL